MEEQVQLGSLYVPQAEQPANVGIIPCFRLGFSQQEKFSSCVLSLRINSLYLRPPNYKTSASYI